MQLLANQKMSFKRICVILLTITALIELMSYFGDPTIVVNAFINQLENWKSTNDYNKQNFVAFSLFLKSLVQAFQYLRYTADPQSSTLLKKAKENVPYNFLLKWTEHIVTSIETPATFVEFQKWLEVQAHVYDKIPCKNFQQNNLRRNNFNNSDKLKCHFQKFLNIRQLHPTKIWIKSLKLQQLIALPV